MDVPTQPAPDFVRSTREARSSVGVGGRSGTLAEGFPSSHAAEPAAVDPRHFRNVMGSFATGITVVTMEEAGERYGITVNAFMSVSLEPALVAVSIDKRANAHATLLDTERFAISVLHAGQEDVSNHFAGRPGPVLGELYTEFAGFPVIRGALANIVCRTYDVMEGGDHSIFLGEVEALRSSEGMPLLYYLGQYARTETVELSE